MFPWFDMSPLNSAPDAHSSELRPERNRGGGDGLGRSWRNTENIMGISWEYGWNIMGISWEYGWNIMEMISLKRFLIVRNILALVK